MTNGTVKESQLFSRMAKAAGIDPDDFYDVVRDTLVPRNRDGEIMASKSQIIAFLMVCDRYRLDPFMKEAYMLPQKKGAGFSTYVPVDGWLAIMSRHPESNGLETEMHFDDKGRVTGCTAKFHRKGWAVPVVIYESYAENKNDRNDIWLARPIRLIRNRTISQVVRVGLGVSGITDDDQGMLSESARPAESYVEPRELPSAEPADGDFRSHPEGGQPQRFFGGSWHDVTGHVGKEAPAREEPEKVAVKADAEPELPDDPGRAQRVAELERMVRESRKTQPAEDDEGDPSMFQQEAE